MKNTPIDSKIEPTRGVHLLRLSKSFLDIPGAAWSSTRLKPVKQAHEVRAPLFSLQSVGEFLHRQGGAHG